MLLCSNCRREKEEKFFYYPKFKKITRICNDCRYKRNISNAIRKQRKIHNCSRCEKYFEVPLSSTRCDECKKYASESKNKIPNTREFPRLTKELYRVRENFMVHIRKFIRKGKSLRNEQYDADLGCKVNDFIDYIYNGMLEGMTPENYGKYWKIDFKEPLRTADTTVETMRERFHYTNIYVLRK